MIAALLPNNMTAGAYVVEGWSVIVEKWKRGRWWGVSARITILWAPLFLMCRISPRTDTSRDLELKRDRSQASRSSTNLQPSTRLTVVQRESCRCCLPEFVRLYALMVRWSLRRPDIYRSTISSC